MSSDEPNTSRDLAMSLPLSGDGILARSDVQPRLPAHDLERARRFYAEKLGLHPVEERDGGLRYRCGSTLFPLFASAGEPSGTHTQMGWKVNDIEATVTELSGRGLEFEEYDFPGFETRDGIVDIHGTYPSEGGVGERSVWFRDSEGNSSASATPSTDPRCRRLGRAGIPVALRGSHRWNPLGAEG